jgi:RsiW-degrading membrane proteinase PrsW (M82 family)
MLAAAFTAGLAAMWLLGHVEDRTAAALGIALHDATGQALVAATHEELAKLAIVVGLALAWRRQFDGPLDGLIYGSFAGLGMAVWESLFYLSLYGQPGIEALGIEIVRLLLHVLLGGLSGFAVALAAARARRWPWAVAAWWTAAATLHFLWDCCVGLPHAALGPSSTATRLGAVALAALTMALFGAAVVLGSRRSREKFAPQSTRSLWAWPFAWAPRRRPDGAGARRATNRPPPAPASCTARGPC